MPPGSAPAHRVSRPPTAPSTGRTVVTQALLIAQVGRLERFPWFVRAQRVAPWSRSACAQRGV